MKIVSTNYKSRNKIKQIQHFKKSKKKIIICYNKYLQKLNRNYKNNKP